MKSFARTQQVNTKKKTKGGETRKSFSCAPTFERENRFHSGVRTDKKSRPRDEEPHSSLNVYHRNKNTHYLHNERYAHIIVYFIIVRDERRCRRAPTVLFFFFFSVFVDEDERISKIHHHEQIWKKRKRTPPSVVKRSSQEYEE